MIQSQALDAASDQAPLAIDLAPLIDVVFILLIFFLVTTTFSRDRGITVERPTAAHSHAITPDVVRVHITASEQCFVEGVAAPLNELEARLSALLAGSRAPAVVVVPDRSVSAGLLVAVMDLATAAGAQDVTLATLAGAAP